MGIFYIWTLFLYHVSTDKSYIFRHRGKNGWTLTFPDSFAAKQWAHDLAVANPDSRAGDTKKQGQAYIFMPEGNGSNIQRPEAAKAEVAELVGSV